MKNIDERIASQIIKKAYSSTCHERTLSGPGKCPYMTGGHSLEGRKEGRWWRGGGVKRNRGLRLARLHYASPPAMFILNTMSCIVIMMTYAGVDLGGIPLSRAPQIFRQNTRFARTVIRPDYQLLPRIGDLGLGLGPLY